MMIVRTALVFLIFGAGHAPAVQAEPATPEPLQPYVELADQGLRWTARNHGLTWKTVYEEKFDQPAGHWNGLHQWLKRKTTDGKTELHVTPPNRTNIAFPIGPKVEGEFAIEMVARADAPACIPLSIMLGDERGDGPGFQFATIDDGVHYLWVNTNRGPSSAHRFYRVRCGTEPRQVRNQTYRLRLEVREGKITGYLDGKAIGEQPLSKHHNAQKSFQPHALTVGPAMIISQWRVETYAPQADHDQAKVDAEAWRKIFGDQTRAQVEARAAELVALLDHDRWIVRDRAEDMVKKTGDLALPSLRAALDAGSAELRMRSRRLLEQMAPDMLKAEDETGE